ncbi:tetratricopeptide repeat protein [Microbulbifer sp. TYP-18]|uniref:tetratricopeptide repeat protein n=1 Tax=Microbulbifer sp. TYP-18 TaxID=3230024 RepID=UPI0034C6208E
MKLTKERWERIQTIFSRVLRQPEESRYSFLQQICEKGSQLYREIELLLDAERMAPTFLEKSMPVNDEVHCVSPRLKTGDRLGAYRLCEEIGRGGMGVVYRAERQEGEFRQEVAVKLLRTPIGEGKAAPLGLKRFQLEQQTLASLNHPNIVQLFDGGVTENQQPYIIMEFVRGVNIHRYCSERALDLNARLSLIIKVAHVLGFAHRNLVVHRDIKPSNILIDGEGQVKLLDFGIAKLLSNELGKDLTQNGESVMTPGFAAPEQIKNERVTVGTDIYQLGLILYELITGHKAFSDQAESLYELSRVMCESCPTLPSVISKNGLHNDTYIAKKLRGDLDAIALKALRREPEHRYSSVRDFAEDIQAHLDGNLVSARQGAFHYRVQNYIYRHWRALAVSVSFVCILIGYAVTVTIQSRGIQQALEKSVFEAEKAQQVSNFLVNIFKHSDPNVYGLDKISAQQLLENGEEKIQIDLREVPGIRSHMLGILGSIYYSQGVYEKSAELLRKAVDQQRKMANLDSLRLADTMTKLAISLSTMNQYEESEKLLQESLTIYQEIDQQSVTNSTIVNQAETINAYANLFQKRGDYEKAKFYFKQAIHLAQEATRGQNEMAVALNGLGNIHHYQGRFEEATEHMRKVIKIQKLVHGEQHSSYTIALNNLATMLTDLERFEEATELSRQALSIQQKILGVDHPYIGETLRALGILSHRTGDFEAAVRYLQQALRVKRLKSQQDNIRIAVVLLWLGTALQDKGEFDAADQHYAKMLEIFQALKVTDKIMGRGLCQPASLALAKGDLETARQLYTQALDLMPETGVRTSIAQLGLARVLLAENKELFRAETLAKSALASRQAKYIFGHSMIAEAEAVLGLIQVEHSPASAITLLKSSDTVLNSHPLFLQRHGAHNLVQSVQQALERLNNNSDVLEVTTVGSLGVVYSPIDSIAFRKEKLALFDKTYSGSVLSRGPAARQRKTGL